MENLNKTYIVNFSRLCQKIYILKCFVDREKKKHWKLLITVLSSFCYLIFKQQTVNNKFCKQQFKKYLTGIEFRSCVIYCCFQRETKILEIWET